MSLRIVREMLFTQKKIWENYTENAYKNAIGKILTLIKIFLTLGTYIYYAYIILYTYRIKIFVCLDWVTIHRGEGIWDINVTIKL